MTRFVLCLLGVVVAMGCQPEPKGKAKKRAEAEESPEAVRPSGGKRGAARKASEEVENPWDRYRQGVIDPLAIEVPGKIQKGVFRDPDRYIEPLVEHLMGEARDEYHKVKLLHDWIADNIRYDTKSYFSGELKRGTFADVLRTGSSVCDGYAGLFNHMCGIAGLQCQKVSGYGRGYGHKLFGAQDVTDSNHAWNAVKIAGRWHLLDITWDAGNIGDDKEFKKDYGTEFLFMDPEQFVYTHLPTEEKWQLLQSPLSARQFKGLPYLRGEFFRYGLELAQDVDGISRVDDKASFDLLVPEEVQLIAHVADVSDRKHEELVLIQREEDVVRVRSLFPGPGNWKVRLFARQDGDADPDRYRWVADLGFQAQRGSSKLFPKLYGHFTTLGCTLHQPLHAPLPRRGEVQFRITVPGVQAVSLAREGESSNWTELVREDGDVFTGTITDIGKTPLNVLAKVNAGDSRWQVVLQY